MGLPEEDKGPSWLRDYGTASGSTEADFFTGTVHDSVAIQVDLKGLKEFADWLKNEHELDYRPHADVAVGAMGAQPDSPPMEFVELTSAMMRHTEKLIITRATLTEHDAAVLAFVEAVYKIVHNYGETDAASAATVRDINTYLPTPRSAVVNTTTTAPTTTTTTTTGGGDEEVAYG